MNIVCIKMRYYLNQEIEYIYKGYGFLSFAKTWVKV